MCSILYSAVMKTPFSHETHGKWLTGVRINAHGEASCTRRGRAGHAPGQPKYHVQFSRWDSSLLYIEAVVFGVSEEPVHTDSVLHKRFGVEVLLCQPMSPCVGVTRHESLPAHSAAALLHVCAAAVASETGSFRSPTPYVAAPVIAGLIARERSGWVEERVEQ
jgi:hypothetical protein